MPKGKLEEVYHNIPKEDLLTLNAQPVVSYMKGMFHSSTIVSSLACCTGSIMIDDALCSGSFVMLTLSLHTRPSTRCASVSPMTWINHF